MYNGIKEGKLNKLNCILKKERTLKGLTQEELANHLNISISTVSMIEKDNRKPSYELLEKIADFFNVDIDYLTGKSPIKRKQEFIEIDQSLVGVAAYSTEDLTDDDLKEIKDFITLVRKKRKMLNEK